MAFTLGLCSGDGTLSSYNFKSGKLNGRSDELEDELLSIQIIKVTCGRTTCSDVIQL